MGLTVRYTTPDGKEYEGAIIGFEDGDMFVELPSGQEMIFKDITLESMSETYQSDSITTEKLVAHYRRNKDDN